MKKTVLSNTAFAAATVFSLGVLSGCDYCQPLLLAMVITLVTACWLPLAYRGTHHENFVS